MPLVFASGSSPYDYMPENTYTKYLKENEWLRLRKGVRLYPVEAGSKWILSSDEIGFHIAVGMALHSHPIPERSKCERERSKDE